MGLTYIKAKLLVAEHFGPTARLERVRQKGAGSYGWAVLVQHKTEKDSWGVIGAGPTYDLAIAVALKRRLEAQEKAEAGQKESTDES